MAERFNLTAVLQLQAPTNAAQVINQIKKDLGKLGVNVKINADSRSLAAVQGQLKKVDKSARSSAKGMGLLGRNISEAARRFSVITIATGSFIALARSMKQSVGAAIEFQRELVKISQVTGKSIDQLSGLSKEVTHLSTSLGVANQSLLETSRILAQAGFTALKTKQALEILANTTLAPSFDNIIDTTEGAIAIINQFGREAQKTGSEIQFLENALDAINQVSKTFAVESKDLITAVRRTGGVFEAAGGKLNELIALFTSVRQTTRESAETIATGFRTIFTRLQRSETIDELNKLGIALSDTEGKFIGPLKAIEALSIGLAGLDPKDVRFNEIVEQLGGFRQIGKVIPLIKQYSVATKALAVANSSAGSTSEDAQTAQQALAVQFQKVREQFDALIRKFAESETFKGMADLVLTLATTFLKFAESLEKVLPLLTAVAAIKIGRSLGPGLAGMFGGGRGKQYGGVVRGFSGGGFVPGTGSQDTVPAMLQPGEFVVKKSSAKKLGPDRLRSMNQNRFGVGGKIVGVGGGTQKSHIGADIEIEEADVRRIFASKSIKFQRSFVHNVLGLNVNELGDAGVKAKYATAAPKAGMKELKKMGVSARTPVMLNLPTNYNQALRDSDPNLVSQSSLASYMQSGPNLFGSLPAPIKKALDGTVLRQSLAAQVGSTRPAHRPGSKFNPTKTSAYDSDSELDPLKHFLRQDLHKVAPQAVEKLFGQMDIFFKGSGKQSISKRTGKLRSGTSTDRTKIQAAAAGGLIQRFAMGGIAKVGQIGAAILDSDMGMAKEGIPVGIKDVQAAIKGSGSEPSLVKKNLGKAYKGKTYNLSRQGLNKKTSDGFKQKIVEGLGVGLDHATSTLGADLGLGASKMDPGSVKEFQNYISKRPVVGDLFESAVQSLGASGKFTEAAVSAPFDFPGGLSGKLKDNYSNLPGSFIDAKSSYAAASTANMKGKVVNELIAELRRSGEYARLSKPMKKKARGGNVSGTDSVPSLLTPGEFVVKKSAAQSIGYSNLQRMNATGMARFATGGTVEGVSSDVTGSMKSKDIALVNAAARANAAAFQQLTEQIKLFDPEQARAALAYFGRNFTEAGDEAALVADSMEAAHVSATANAAGTAGSGTDPLAGVDADPGMSEMREKVVLSGDALAQMAENSDHLAERFSIMGEETAASQAAQLAYRQAVQEGADEVDAMNAGFAAGHATNEKFNKGLKALTKQHAEGKISDEQLKKATEKLKKKLLERSQIGPGSKGGAGAPPKSEVNAEATKKFAAGMESAAGKMQQFGNIASRVSSGLIGLTFIAGTLIQSSTGLSEAQKEQEQAGLNQVAAYGAVIAEVISFSLAMAANIASMVASRAAKLGEAAASGSTVVAKVAETFASWAAAAGLTGLSAAVMPLAIVFAIIAAFMVGGFLLSMYKTAKAVKAMEQSIEKFNDVADKELEKLESTGQGDKDTFVDAQAGAAVTEFNKSVIEAGASARNMGTAVDVGMLAASGAIVGAWVGSIFPVIGTAIGAVAGALIGGAIGFVKNWLTYDAALEAEIKAEQARAKKVADISNLYANTTWDATKAVKAFETSMQSAKDANLTAGQTMNVLIAGSNKLFSTFEQGEKNLAEAVTKKADLHQELVGQGIITEGGEEVAVGTGDDAEERTDAQQRALAMYKQLTKQEEQARSAHSKNLQTIMSLEQEARSLLAKSFGEAHKALKKTGQLDAVTSFNELLNVDPELAKRYREGIALINRKIDLEFKAALEEAEKSGDAGRVEAVKGAREGRKEVADLEIRKGEQERNVADKRAALAAVRSEIVERAKQQAILDVNAAMMGLNHVINAMESEFAALDNAIAVATGGLGKIAQISVGALDQPLRQVAPEQLNKALATGASALQGGEADDSEIGQLASRITKRIKTTQDIMLNAAGVWGDEAAKGAVIGQDKIDAKVERLMKELADAIPGKVIPPDLKDIIEGELREQIDKGGGLIDTKFMEDLFAGLEGGAAAQADLFKKAVEIQNRFLVKLDEVNNAIIDAQNKQLESAGRVIDIEEAGADRLAEARGKPRSKEEKEEGRRRAAQARLGGGALAGAAGDVKKTAKALKDFRDASSAANRAMQEAANRPEPDTKEVERQRAILNENASAAKRATGELERLADQSARLSDIEAELAEVQKAKGQIGAVVEDFAFGSDKGRVELGQQFITMNKAISQGSLEGANEKERGQVAKSLDALSDVKMQFGGKEMTGREIKAALAEKEFIAMGGDPEVAKMVRESIEKGTREEQLLAQIAGVTKEQVDAAKELEKDGDTQLQTLHTIRELLKGTLKVELAKAKEVSAEQIAKDKEKKVEDDKALEAKEKQLQTAFDLSVTNLGNLSGALDLAKQRVQDFLVKNEELKGDGTTGGQHKYGSGTKGKESDHKPGSTEAYNAAGGQAETGQTYEEYKEYRTGGGGASTDGGMSWEEKKRKGLLKQDESGAWVSRGGMIYRAGGGSIFQPRGTDTVPAMLTPGEFVMRKAAVQKYGVGFMKRVNNSATGFRHGGQVQYRQNGGMMGGGGLDALVEQFSGFSTAVNSLATAIQGGMTLTHQFTGNLALAFKIENADQLKNAIAGAITPTLSRMITEEIDKKIKFLKDNP